MSGDASGSARRRFETPSLVDFTVPPRFDDATFASYRPDPDFPSQQQARDRLQDAVASLGNGAKRGLFGRLFGGAQETGWTGLYLDGRFGVGKTHLLAASFHTADVAKAYLSFSELTYAVGALGMPQAVDLFAQARLICLDEFELDDPGNTMLATSFVRQVVGRGSRLIVTSNTLPGELGRGRFSADDFSREIGELSSVFESIRIDGEDYRHRTFSGSSRLPRIVPRPAVSEHADPIDWPELLRRLSSVPPLHYPELITELGVPGIVDMESIPDQDTALRFVHFIDKLYDRGTPLIVSTDCTLDEIFPPSYGYGGFERKFRRCQSRLHEMLAQPLDIARGVDWTDDGIDADEGHTHAHQAR